VDANTIKLTSYFGERRRTSDAFVGDTLLDLYARRGLGTSILLRGAEGTGLRHHLRTDSSLSQSEDLPVTVTAVDTRENIEAVLDQTVELNQDGLVTLESVLLLPEQIGPARAATAAAEAVELTVYFSRQDSVFTVPAFEEICDLLHRREIEGATVLLGLDGVIRGHRHRAQFFSRSGDVPMLVVAVGPADLIGSVLPELGGLLRHPVITLGRVRICKRDGQLISRPGQEYAEGPPSSALWQKLTVYTPETGPHVPPVHRAIVRELRFAKTSGATVHRGIWGFHGDQPPHGDRFLQWGRHVPVITTVIDTAENIALAFDIIDRLTGDQELVTSENILVMRRAAMLP
jgi:PII-like signaling protein